MSDRTFKWAEWIGTRPSGPVAARIVGVRQILLERADAARAAASGPDVDSRFAASLRGKSHAYWEAAELLGRIDQGQRLGFKRWTRKDDRERRQPTPTDGGTS